MPAAPSLLIVPYRSKTGKLYSQIPTSGAGDFTVTRNTEARRFTSAGLIASVASGIPRLDYYTSGGTAGCPALLVEPAATNLCLQSEAFNTTWTISNSTQITTNTTGTTDPAGSTLSDLIFCQASGSAVQGVTQTVSIATSGTYTMSVFVKKAANFDWIRIQFQDPAAGTYQVYYNLASGTLGAVDAGSTGTITNFGNGWYRVTHSRSTASGSITFGLRLANANSVLTVPCDGISGAYIFGAQLETGSVATSYIPTTTGTGSRSADVISVTGAVSGSIGQTEGTVYCEYIPVASGPAGASFFTNIITSARNINTNTGFSITHRQSDNTLRAEFFIGNGTLGSITLLSGTVAFGNVVKVAFAYKTGDFALAINGNVVQTTSVPFTSVTTINTIELTNPNIYFGYPGTVRHRAAALYTTRLTNAELATLTTL